MMALVVVAIALMDTTDRIGGMQKGGERDQIRNSLFDPLNYPSLPFTPCSVDINHLLTVHNHV